MKNLILFSVLLMISFVCSGQITSYTCGTPNKLLSISCPLCPGTAIYQWTSPSNVTTSGVSVTATQAGVWTWQVSIPGCSPATGTHTIISETQPTFSINATNTCLNSSQTVTASGVPAGYTYSWNFGVDASPATSTASSESVSWSSAGTKTITLTITKVLPSGACTGTCVWTATTTIDVISISATSTCN